MRYKWDKKYLYWGITAFAVIVAAMFFRSMFFTDSKEPNVIISFFTKLMGALSPVFYGFAFAYLLNPIENFFEKKVYMRLAHKRMVKNDPNHEYGNEAMIKTKKWSRVFGVTCAMLILLLVITGIILIIVPQLISTIQGLVGNMQGYFNEAREWVNNQLVDYPEAQEWLNNSLDNAFDTIMDWLNDTIMPQMTDIIATFTGGLITVIQVFMNIFFGLVIAIYFLYSKELFAAQLKKLLYSISTPRYGNAVVRNLREVHKTFGGFLSGKIIDSLIIMILFFIILTVFNFPYAALCSVLMGIFNIIPVFGPFIGAVPCALLVLLEDPLYFIYFVIVVIVVQQLDGNVIGPMVLGESTGLSSFWIIFALLVGQSIFGFIGLIIGIPLFAVIYAIVRSRVGRKLEGRGLPKDSNVYRKVAYVDEDTGELITLYEMNEKNEIRRAQAELEKQTKHGTLRRKLTKLHRKKEK